jgi:HAD superfamily phosphatase (TIGR01668 family)
MDEIYTATPDKSSRYRFSKVPNYIAPGALGINYDQLAGNGVRHLVFDVDNTLVSFGERDLSPEIRDLILRLQESRKFISIRLATNSPRRLKWLKDELGLHITQPRPWRFKPLPSFYNYIQRSIHDQPGSIAMIGDKLIQDIWGANAAGFTSVLVQPLGRDNIIDRIFLFRWHERRLLRKYLPHHIEKWF